MPSMNKVIIAGHLTRDPDARRTTGGTSVCNLGVAINNKRKDQSGQYVDDTVFVDVTAWGKTADFARDYMRKGNPVLIEGRLTVESWEDRNSGQKRSKMLVTAERVESLAPRQQTQQQQPHQHTNGYQQPPQQPPQQQWTPPPQSPPPPFNQDDSIDDVQF